MPPVAVLHMWSDPVWSRSCYVLLHEHGCQLEILFDGVRHITAELPTMSAAFALAEDCRPPYASSKTEEVH